MRLSRVAIATGPTLHYAEQGNAGGDAVVFLHGWPDSWFSFSRVAALIPESYRALLVDQRGFGESERPESGYSIGNMAADVAAFLDALSIERATIVGHSFGSFVARRVAIDYPNRVDRLVLIGTGWLGSNDVTREVYVSLRDLADPVPRDFAREFQASTAFAPLPEAFFEQIVTESLKLPFRLWAELLGSVIKYDDVNELAKIVVPTQVLWGDRDVLFPRDDQERFVAAVPHARLRIYPEIGHCPNWECPDAVARDIVAFVSQPRPKERNVVAT
jgi:non-heme chloroperoxidase